jgi:hypothetical protein
MTLLILQEDFSIVKEIVFHVKKLKKIVLHVLLDSRDKITHLVVLANWDSMIMELNQIASNVLQLALSVPQKIDVPTVLII